MYFHMNKMKNFQLTGVMKVAIGILFICFLLGTTYIASRLSSIPTKSFLHSKINHHPSRSDFIQILIRTESTRLIGAVTLVNSIISNTRNPVHFYFITDQESSKELFFWIENSKLYDISYEIKIVNPTDAVASHTTENENWLESTLIYIPVLFPQADGRLIVLSDDIIVQGDIVELNNMTIAQNHFGALSTDCDTVSKHFVKNQNKYVHYFDLKNSALKYKNINGTRCIFDMGVMVLNMTLWKEKDATKQLVYWIELNQKESFFHINNILSPFLLVFYDQVSPLRNSWHVRHLGSTTGSRYSRDFLQKADLLHWDGHFKPWKHKSPYMDLWQKYVVAKPKLNLSS